MESVDTVNVWCDVRIGDLGIKVMIIVSVLFVFICSWTVMFVLLTNTCLTVVNT
jgi:hypothetical protein